MTRKKPTRNPVATNEPHQPIDKSVADFLLDADRALPTDFIPSYGDVTTLNADGLIKRSVEPAILTNIVGDFLSLLGTSSAIYEKNGDYAFGIFSSGWCRCLDDASFRLCDTSDLRQALACGKWLCHESCWADASRVCIERNAPVDCACSGGLRLYTVPIQVDGTAVGSINFGYGSPPRDEKTLMHLAQKYGVPYSELAAKARAYRDRPTAIIDLARRRLTNAAMLIGSLVKRRLTEEALRQSEERLRLAHKATNDVVWDWDVANDTQQWNEAGTAVFGWTEIVEHPVNAHWWVDRVHPDDRQRVHDTFFAVVNDPRSDSWHDEYRFRKADGTYAEVLDRGYVLRDPHGKAVRMIGAMLDITARKRSEDALRENEEKYRDLIHAIPSGLFLYQFEEPDRLILLDGNPEAERLTGMRIGDWRGKEFNELWPEARRTGITDSYLEAFRTDTIFEQEDLRYDDERVSGAFRVRAFRLPNQRLAVAFENVTQRKQAEDALREAHERLAGILAGISDGFFFLDERFRVTDYNLAAERLLGRCRADVMGRSLWDAFPEARGSIFETNYTQALREKRFMAFESYFDVPPLRNWYDVRVHPIGNGIAVFFQVTTERRAAEERLRQSEKMNAIGQLAGGVAHDFNNQLAGILGYADMLIDRLDEPAHKRYAENIRISAHRAADLTRQLLAFSRKGKYLSVPVEMHKVIAEVVALLEHSIDKRIEIQQELRANPHTTLGDPTQLQNAILNLAVNGRDAMPGGGTLTFATSVAELPNDPVDPAIQAGRYLQISVTDTGVGMDAETMKHLFEPFFTTKEKGKGTGLGLAAVHGTIRNHRGRIQVESKPGKGTTFVVSLPLLDESASASNDAHAPPTACHSARILVVDDEELCRDLAADLLRSLGHKVTTCANGVEAIALYEQSWEQIDLVILDLIMPRIGGRDTYVALRKINPGIRAVLASGYGIDGEAQQILDLGVQAFLQKPFTRMELAQKVADVLTGI